MSAAVPAPDRPLEVLDGIVVPYLADALTGRARSPVPVDRNMPLWEYGNYENNP